MSGEVSGGVILLTGEGLPHRLLAAELVRHVPLVGILVQRRQPSTGGRAAGLKARVRRALGGNLYRRLLAFKRYFTTPRIERQVARVEGELRAQAEAEMLASLGGSPPPGWPAGVEVMVKRSPNLKSAVAWCRQRQPDLILVYGTSILKGPMIRVPRLGVLNAHSSILPGYRGVFSEFWQTLHGRLESAGVTIHFIDEGVDTGDLVLQQQTASEAGVDPYRLRCHNVLTTLDAYPKAALQVLSGEAEHSRQRPSNQPTYRARDLTFARRLELLRKLGKL